ncbi:MAG: SPASM domain-containing protein [Candidatus Promineifilaceae bacterium]|nr:SPASM domain-containing protein [Candidatus Promineifilaceae bacterium]
MSTAIKDFLGRLLQPPEPEYEPAVTPGLYHYVREAEGMFTRFHLRADPDGRGMLIANATIAAHLSPTGVLIAKGTLEHQDQDEIIATLARHFSNVEHQRVERDLDRISELIDKLITPIDNYPIVNLEDAAISPFKARLMAPLQADTPLIDTHNLNTNLLRLWQAAIPHVTFLTVEETPATEIVRAVERAEDLGMIAGLRARASDLSHGVQIQSLAQAGLDHASIFYASADKTIHDQIYGRNDSESARTTFSELQFYEIAPIAIVPLVETTVAGLEETLVDLLSRGVSNVFFFAVAVPDELFPRSDGGVLRASALPQVATLVEELSAYHEVRFIWQAPVMRDDRYSLADQLRRGARCSDEISILVEADGEVIPPRGPNRSAGNLLSDDWPAIWNNEAFRRYRERVEMPTRCSSCPGMAICAADCPQEILGWSLPSAED